MPNFIGQQLGNYRLVRLLGRGGFAHVYLGEHVHLKSLAAVKVLDIEVINNNEQEHFLTEARNIANLRHPNIVRVLDFDVKDKMPFLVMEYAPNGSLAMLHPKGSRLLLPTIVSYVKQVAAALQFAHDQMRLIHCDVKPANMLLGYNHEVLLSDFGIALVAPGSRAASLEHIKGTLAYMAPEHLNRRPVLASDQYALAVVVFEWLCGNLPFHGSPVELYQQHRFAPPPSLRERMPTLPFMVEQVVQRALEKDPQQRFPRVQDFAAALEEAVRGSTLFPDTRRTVLPDASSNSTATEQAAPAQAAEPIFVGPSTEPVSPSDPTELAPSPMAGPFPQERIPVHPLLRQQREMIQHFYRVMRGYEWRKEEVQQKRNEERRMTAEYHHKALKEVDKEVQEVRKHLQEMRSRMQKNEWDGLIGTGTFTSIPLAVALNNNPAQQMTACWSAIHDLHRVIDVFLKRYPQPSKLLILSAVIAGVAAVIFGFLSAIAFYSAGGLILAIMLALVVFVIGGFTFFSSQIAPLRRAYATLQQVDSFVGEVHRQRRTELERMYNWRLSELERRHDQSIEQVEQEVQEQLARLRLAFATFINQAGFSGVAWDDPLWKQWKLQNTPSPVTRIGSLSVGAQSGLPPLPALVFCPGGCNLLFKAADTSKAAVMLAVQALLLRLVATQPAGKVRFTLIDPAGLGQNVATILQLADPDKMLGTYQAWVDDQEIEQQLRNLTRRIRDINQKLRSQYASVEEYNRAVGEHAEPSHILVVLDFPANFTPRAAKDLLTIVQNGPRCGVSTIMVSDVKLGTKRFLRSLADFDVQELEKAASVITWHEQHFTWQDPDFQGCQFELDALPQQGLVNHVLQEVGRNPSTSASVEQNPLFKDVLLNLKWRAPREKVKAWLGHPVTGVEPTELSFQRQGGSNLLILGKQEEPAIAMLITMMMSLAAQCSPATARFYVLDLSVVDPALLYVTNTGPLEFVTQLIPEYREREVNRPVLRTKLPSLIREISDIVEDRIDSGVGAASSIYLFICGLQEVDDLRQNDARSKENAVAADTLQRFLTILRKGAKLGVHTLVWCDTLSSLKKMLGDSPLEHFDNRVVFRVPSKEDSIALIGEADAVELSQERAFLFSSEKGRLEKFRPYDRPSKEWLEWAASEIRQKGDDTKKL